MCRRLGGHVLSRRRVVGWPACASHPRVSSSTPVSGHPPSQSFTRCHAHCIRPLLFNGGHAQAWVRNSFQIPRSTTPPRPMDEAKAGPLRTHNLTLTRLHRCHTCPTSANHTISLSPVPWPHPVFSVLSLTLLWLLATHVVRYITLPPSDILLAPGPAKSDTSGPCA